MVPPSEALRVQHGYWSWREEEARPERGGSYPESSKTDTRLAFMVAFVVEPCERHRKP